MNTGTLVWHYLKARPLNTVINILLLALGVAVIIVLILFNNQLRSKIEQNARGIDLVVGAKGSPLQLILCNVFHIDFPTGNIRLQDAERIAQNRLVKSAIPLALGDSYQSFRIIGTQRAFADLYRGEIGQGKWFEDELDVVLGERVSALTGLKIGDTFASAHGMVSGGHDHDQHTFRVVGVMKASSSVLDNLILTSIESVWHVHDLHPHEENVRDTSFVPSPLVPGVERGDSTLEITSLLLQYRTPLAAIQLPRLVNSQSALQAASPVFEIQRLFAILGVGADILMAFAYVLICISALSIFIALYNSLKERRYDLAIMRSMGATRRKLVVTIMSEGVAMTILGSMLGTMLGHGVVWGLQAFVEETQKAGITAFVFFTEEWILLAGSLLLGVVCSIIPAWQAYRTDISKVLSGN